MSKKKELPRCVVCGSSAPIHRINRRTGKDLALCYHHETVCWDHLADPCSTCM